MRMLRGMVLGCAAGALLCGCTVGPDYKSPDTPMPNFFTDAVAAIRTAISPAAPTAMTKPKIVKGTATPVAADLWWRSLDDAQLNALIDRAVAENLDLAVALARLQEAQTQEAVILGISLPDVSADAAVGKGTGSDVTRSRIPSDLTSAVNGAGLKQVNAAAGFDAVWELDIFGLYRREIEAARYDTEAAAAARNAVLISVIGDVVRAYVDLRGLQTRLAILRQDVAAETAALGVVQTRYNRGLTNELDLALAQRELASLSSGLAPLVSQIEAARNTIAILVGSMPQEFANELAQPAPIPPLPQKIEPGLPLDLLRRRPDIHEAERQLAAATARIGVATADLFPHLGLTGAGGVQAQAFGVGPAHTGGIWAAGPSFYWDILDFGTLDAVVEVADLRAKEQLAAYKQTVLRAVGEVDNAIADFTAQQDRLDNLSDALVAAQKALALAQQRYDRGLTDYLNVLDAERQEYTLEDQFVTAQIAAAEDFAALYKAIGGGWERYQAIPPIRQPQPAIVAAVRHALEGQ
jgi:NodT family efflux transporter outer membrane factor (OMF) lipoprotein